MRDRKINVGDADTILMHALAGRIEWALVSIGRAVIMAKGSERQVLADYFASLPLLQTNAPICPDNLYVSWLLRLAQFDLLKVMTKPETFA